MQLFIFDDPCLDRLGDAYFDARQAEIPSLVRIRATRKRLCQYIAWCIANRLWEETEEPARRPDLRVITNEARVHHNPRRMSSPLKTDEIRAFEARVSRVFGIDASAMMEWPAKPEPHH